MDAKLGSFRYSFAEKRERERLLSSNIYPSLSFLAPSGGEVCEEDEQPSSCFSSFRKRVAKSCSGLREFGTKAIQMGKSDPRKVVFAAKMALALMMISLLIFLEEPFEDVSRYCVWAILTVVVVFEFSIGATLSKGFNRGLGTLSAGGLALGMAVLSTLAGELEELVLIISIFLIGFCATYLKLYPTMKPYEYGFRVFLLTYCFIMVSGYRTREFVDTAVTRFLLIAIGASVCLAVNIFIYPIWAGEDLHNLVVKNFFDVADSLEGCVNVYLRCVEYRRVPSKILTYEASDDPLYSGYRSAIESKSQEDTLVGFAIWEPPHGPYKMLKYPWKSYTKVSGALRHCAFMVMALHGCILSEIQAPAEKRKAFQDELQKVGLEGAEVLRQIGGKIKAMEKLGSGDILLEVHKAAEELQKKIDKKSYLLVRSELWEIGSNQRKGTESLNVRSTDSNNFPHDHDSVNPTHVLHSLLDFGDLPASDALSSQNQNGCHNATNAVQQVSSSNPPLIKVLRQQISLPASAMCSRGLDPHHGSEDTNNDGESTIYDNASAMSLATFTSLLIEFVARLQNLVDSFEELSVKANFKEYAAGDAVREETPFHIWFRRCFWSRD